MATVEPNRGQHSVRAEKAALRNTMRQVRGRLSSEERARSAVRIEDRLFGLPGFAVARTVLLFSSFGSEVPTGRIAVRLLSEGRRIFMPFLQDDVMHAAEVLPGQPLVPSSYGPEEPPSRAPVDPNDIDAVVAPGLAFDRAGFRLGYGGGHFDRYMRSMKPGAMRVGIAFHPQVVDAVPHGGRDVPVHFVVTDEETIVCGQPRP